MSEEHHKLEGESFVEIPAKHVVTWTGYHQYVNVSTCVHVCACSYMRACARPRALR